MQSLDWLKGANNLKVKINNAEYTFEENVPETAVDLIRHHAQLKGTKQVCGSGVCGACTVLVDGTPMVSCLLPAHHLEGKRVQTIEAFSGDNLHPVQRALMAHDGLQCGYWVLSVHSALEPHCAVAMWDKNDHVTVYLSTQAISAMQHHIADYFDIPDDNVTIIAQHVGGGFGAKVFLFAEAIAAVALARRSGKPVAVIPSRPEEMNIGGMHPGGRFDITIGLDKNLDLKAMIAHAYHDGGVAIGNISAIWGAMGYRGGSRDLQDYVEINGERSLTMQELYGDGTDGTREHMLAPNDILTHIILPAPVADEQSGYFRSISRARAEWALVEVNVRLVVDETNNEITFARVAMGGVAPVPLLLPKVDEYLLGKPANAETFAAAAEIATEGVNPLPQTGYKVKLIYGTVLDTLDRALNRVWGGEG